MSTCYRWNISAIIFKEWEHFSHCCPLGYRGVTILNAILFWLEKNPEQLQDNRPTDLVVSPLFKETCAIDMWGFSCCTLNWQRHKELISPPLCVQRWFWKLKSHFSHEQKQLLKANLLYSWISGDMCAYLFWLSEWHSFSICHGKLIDQVGRKGSCSWPMKCFACLCFPLFQSWSLTLHNDWEDETILAFRYSLTWPMSAGCLLASHSQMATPCMLPFSILPSFLNTGQKNSREK